MKLLIIDNDQKFRETWLTILEKLGHLCLTLRDLQEQSVEALNAAHFDLALIDRRTVDDDDKFDTSGQDFAVNLCSLGTPSVLVTSFVPNEREIFDLLWSGSISGIADKALHLLETGKCIDEFGFSHRFPNCHAKFRWKGLEEAFSRVDWEVIRERCPGADAGWADFAVLFRSLIPQFAHTVEVQPISPGRGGTALVRARIFAGDVPVAEDVAIKYGSRPAIRSEAMRYDRYVGPLPDGVAAHLRWRKETGNLGALAYSWVGDSVEDGVPFGPPNKNSAALPWRRRRAAVDRLFSASLNPWYSVYRSGTGRPPSPISLVDYYIGADAFHNSVPFVDDVLPEDLPQAVTVEGDRWNFGPYGVFVNAAKWVNQVGGSTFKLTTYCPCHGDLHVKNIFVLPDDSPRLYRLW